MSLHGGLAVNGRSINKGWSAQRVDGSPNSDGGWCTYECEVWTESGSSSFMIRHRYDDGALVLASKVLARAVEVGAR